MKTMSCKQLGGACDQTFSANTFEEMASLSKEHGKEMFKKNDAAHLEAMRSMQKLMETPNAIQDWFQEKRKAFDALSED
jgi:predicted small metal-binding protein